MPLVHIDLTTSRQYVGKNAVGIVRTEREIASDFLRNSPDARFFHYEAARNAFVAIPRDEAAAILLGQASPRTAEAPAPEILTGFEPGSVVLSCGLVWDHNFLELLYGMKQRDGFRVVQVVYDVIPTIMPEYCVPGMDVQFPKFVLDAAWTADAIYCISDSTLEDVRRFLDGADAPVPALRRFELGSDVSPGPAAASRPAADLRPGRFVLYVSTIEPRKNHQMLFNIWRTLLEEMGPDLPTLVLVGKPAWNSADLMAMMGLCTRLVPGQLRVLDGVSDGELNWLYENCRFTVYPSLYEGWGLPVRESFLHGKLCLCSANSGTAEAGAGCSVPLDPLDYAAWLREIRHFIRDDKALRRQEKRIAAEFHPVRWSEAAARFRSGLLADAAALGS